MTTNSAIDHDRVEIPGGGRISAGSDGGVRVRVAADAVLSAYVNDLSGPGTGTGGRTARDRRVLRRIGYEPVRRRRGLELACAAAS